MSEPAVIVMLRNFFHEIVTLEIFSSMIRCCCCFVFISYSWLQQRSAGEEELQRVQQTFIHSFIHSAVIFTWITFR